MDERVPKMYASAAQVEDYERYLERLSTQFAGEALEMLGDVSGLDVLDVAAGTGAFAVPAARAGAMVCAVDTSRRMVERLEERLAPFPACRAKVMDGQKLSARDGRFDVAASFFGLITFPDFRAGLSEAFRVLRRGGRACILSTTDPLGAGQAIVLVRAIERAFSSFEFQMPEGIAIFSDVDRLAGELRSVGFETVEHRNVTRYWRAESRAAFESDLDRIYSNFPPYTMFDGEELTTLKRAIVDVAGEFIDDAGNVAIPTAGLITTARKAP